MKKINKGYIKNGMYVKHCTFAKAVLWKFKELSIPLDIFNALQARKIEWLKFVDKSKQEVWGFYREDIEGNGVIRKVGQEEQFYFPINLAIKEEYDKDL